MRALGQTADAWAWVGETPDTEKDRKDALRFRYLQNLPVVEAQAFFWNYGSRTERAKAIDKAMHAVIDRIEENR